MSRRHELRAPAPGGAPAPFAALAAVLALLLVLVPGRAPAGVAGQIRDAATGLPVAGATVAAEGSAVPPATTGGDGTYRLGVPDSRWDLVISAGGYLPFTIRAVTVEGEAMADAAIAPSGTGHAIVGTVRAEIEGEPPLPGVRVRLRGSEWLTRTGDDGSFRFEGLPAGPYVLDLDAGGGCAEAGFVSEQVRVDVSADAVDGERGGVVADVHLHPDDPADRMVLCGTVRASAGGAPVGLASVFAMSGGSVERAGVAAADGSFALRNLPEGTYSVIAARCGHEPVVLEGVELGAEAYPDLHAFVDPVVPHATGRGEVWGFLGLADNPVDRSGTFAQLAAQGFRDSSEPSAEYRFTGVPPGVVVLSGGREGYTPLFRGLVLVRGGAPTRIDEALTPLPMLTFRVHGIVREAGTDVPLAGARIQLDDLVAGADEEGRFEFLDVVQGTHTIVATRTAYAPYAETFPVGQEDAAFDIHLAPDPTYDTGTGQLNEAEQANSCACGHGASPDVAGLALAAWLAVRAFRSRRRDPGRGAVSSREARSGHRSFAAGGRWMNTP